MLAHQAPRNVQNDDLLALSESNVYTIVSHGATVHQRLREESESDSSSSDSDTESLNEETETESSSSGSGDEDFPNKEEAERKRKEEEEAERKRKEEEEAERKRKEEEEERARKTSEDARKRISAIAELHNKQQQELLSKLRTEQTKPVIKMINNFLQYMMQNPSSALTWQDQRLLVCNVPKHFQFPSGANKNKFFADLLQKNLETGAPEQFLWILMYAYLYVEVNSQVDELVFDFIWKMYCLLEDPMFDEIMLQAFKHAFEDNGTPYSVWNQLCIQQCKQKILTDTDYTKKMLRLFFHNKRYDSKLMSFLQTFYENQMFDLVDPVCTHYYMSDHQILEYMRRMQDIETFKSESFDVLVWKLKLMQYLEIADLTDSTDPSYPIPKNFYELFLVKAVSLIDSGKSSLSESRAHALQKLWQSVNERFTART